MLPSDLTPNYILPYQNPEQAPTTQPKNVSDAEKIKKIIDDVLNLQIEVLILQIQIRVLKKHITEIDLPDKPKEIQI